MLMNGGRTKGRLGGLSDGFGCGACGREMKVERLMHAHGSMIHVTLRSVADVRSEVTENNHGNNMENAGEFDVTVDVVMTMYLSGARGSPSLRLK